MKMVAFTEFRKNASNFLSKVEKGETLLVLRYGKAIAEISPPIVEDSMVPSWKKSRLKLTTKGRRISKMILEERKSL